MSNRIGLITACVLVVVGLILFAVGMTAHNWDFTKLSTGKYETNTHEISGKITDISINTDMSDILFAPSTDGAYKVVSYEKSNMKHSVHVQDDTLLIKVVDERKWYEYIGINFSTPKLTVYLSEGEYGSLVIESSTGDVEIPKEFRFDGMDISESTGDVTIHASASGAVRVKTSTGNIRVESISVGDLDLSVSTGRITASDVTCEGDVTIRVSTGKTNMSNIECENIISSGSTGNISLKNVIASERISLRRSTGDVRFDACDAAEIFVETDTGDVTGTLRLEKIFFAETSTGRINVPKSTTGGRCEVRTSTGDIKFEIQ